MYTVPRNVIVVEKIRMLWIVVVVVVVKKKKDATRTATVADPVDPTTRLPIREKAVIAYVKPKISLSSLLLITKQLSKQETQHR